MRHAGFRMKALSSIRRGAGDGHGSVQGKAALPDEEAFDGSGTIVDAAHLSTGSGRPPQGAAEAAPAADRSAAQERVRNGSDPGASAEAARAAPDSIPYDLHEGSDLPERVAFGLANAEAAGGHDWEATGSLVAPLGFEVEMPMDTSSAGFPQSDSVPATGQPQCPVAPEIAVMAIEQNGLAVVVWEADGRIVSTNAAFARLTGYTAADFGRWNLCLLASGRHNPEFFSALWNGVMASGRWQGELWIRARDGREISCLLGLSALCEAGAVRRYVAVFADLTAERHAHEESLRLAHEDPLTGLANRRLLIDRLRQAIAGARRTGAGVAVLFVDLDGFRYINDSFARSTGDEVLRLTARRLLGCVREQDTVARLGSDEFVVLLPGIGDGTQAMTVVRKMGAELFQPMALGSREQKVTASVGISLFPDDGTDPQALIQHAETAMFGAKARGRNSYAFYRRQMTEQVQSRLHLEASLARALERNELSVVFQPQIDVANGVVTGAETLLRWQHPELGAVAPERFIPLAEESGLIRPIGSWVLRSVCEQLSSWRREGLGPLRLAVNVSPLQIARRKHTDQLTAILAKYWEPGGAMELEIEITESSLQTSEDSMAAAGLFKSAGATLAIDDFGTGYSSLMTLRQLPVDRLKLDRSFIDGVTADAGRARLAAAAIIMGRTMGLRVLAEGVEDDAQLAFLRRQGCHEAQGFLIGRPMSATDFRELVLRSRTGH